MTLMTNYMTNNHVVFVFLLTFITFIKFTYNKKKSLQYLEYFKGNSNT